MAGYSGENCASDINECASRPCENGGSCADGLDAFSCSCPAGWTGTTCAEDVDECGSFPCRNGADCLNAMDAYACTCSDGWTDENCDEAVDECASYPCANEATCVDLAAAYQCSCADGFAGENCLSDVDECGSMPCLHGVCQDMRATYACECHPGWTGNNCAEDMNECAANVNPCAHESECTNTPFDGNRGYTCACSTGWAGEDCTIDVDECGSAPCEHGICNDAIASFTCDCGTSGWEGELCENDINDCSVVGDAACTHGGSCTDAGPNTYFCTCAPGFTSTNEAEMTNCDRELIACPPDQSKCDPDNAVCEDLGFGRSGCRCNPGFETVNNGRNCTEINECGSNPCMRGQCTDDLLRYACACPAGWSGDNCGINVDECVRVDGTSPCANGATCIDGMNSYACRCSAGWSGQNCEDDIDECLSNPCRNFGVCSEPRTADDRPIANLYQCDCAAGWAGSRCQDDINECAAAPCANGADCTDRVNGFVCSCVVGFLGDMCDVDIDECVSVPCQNGGACSQGIDSWTCNCESGYAGSICDQDLDECESSPCANEAACFDGSFAYSCACRSGFNGNNCDNSIPACDSTTDPCDPDYGICIQLAEEVDGRSFACECFPGFDAVPGEGALASVLGAGPGGCRNIDDCTNGGQAVCANGGTCTDLLMAFTCACSVGFQGPTCEVDIDDCMSSPCGEHGECEDGANSFTCSCEEHWSGERCEFTDLVLDCAGTLGGTMVLDDCGVCGPPCQETDPARWARSCPGYNSCADCAGRINGRGRVDPCGICVASGRYSENCILGCDGNFPNLAESPDAVAVQMDRCGVCGGSNSCIDCAGQAITRASLAAGVEASSCDNCGTCDSDKENDCRIDCNGNYMCAATFEMTTDSCPDDLDGEALAQCFRTGTGSPLFSQQCLSQTQCDAMPVWADTQTHASAKAAEVDSCQVCGGDGTSCRRDYAKISLTTDLSQLQTEEQLQAYKVTLAAALGVDPDQLNINLPSAASGRRHLQSGGIEIVITGDAPEGDATQGAALPDTATLAASVATVEGVDGVQATEIAPDCLGVPGGDAVMDDCGLCGGDSSSCQDCNGVPNGLAVLDRCNVCDADPTNDCTQDCQGTWGGNLLMDVCGVCGGTGSACIDCNEQPAPGHEDYVNCTGDLLPNGPDEAYTCGAAAVDSCGTCDKDTSNDCVQDCAGQWGGPMQTLQCASLQLNGPSTTVCAQSCPPVDCIGAWTEWTDCTDTQSWEVVDCGQARKSRRFAITRAASGVGAAQCEADANQEVWADCDLPACSSYAYLVPEFPECPTDCESPETILRRQKTCVQMPSETVVNDATCVRQGVDLPVGEELTRICPATETCPEKQLEAARAQITLGGAMDDLAGSGARAAFETQFKANVAQAIVAHRDSGTFTSEQVEVVSVVDGSIIVTFDVFPSEDGSMTADDALGNFRDQINQHFQTFGAAPSYGGESYTVVPTAGGEPFSVIAAAGASAIDCTGDWGDWEDCTCPEQCVSVLGDCAQESRVYTVSAEAANGGVECSASDGETESRSCDTVCNTCSDGVQNGDETGEDCGGSCDACESAQPRPRPAPAPAPAPEEDSGSIWWVILLVLCCCGGAGGGGFFVVKKKMADDAAAGKAHMEFEITDNPTAEEETV